MLMVETHLRDVQVLVLHCTAFRLLLTVCKHSGPQETVSCWRFMRECCPFLV